MSEQTTGKALNVGNTDPGSSRGVTENISRSKESADRIQPGSTPAHPLRMVQLDFLRGIAILLVLGHHSIMNARNAGWLKIPAMVWFRLGWTAVDLFFVLNGFLVGGLFFKEYRKTGRLDIKRFVIRRGFKIWPSYYMFLCIQLLWIWVVDRKPLIGAFRLYTFEIGCSPLGPTRYATYRLHVRHDVSIGFGPMI